MQHLPGITLREMKHSHPGGNRAIREAAYRHVPAVIRRNDDRGEEKPLIQIGKIQAMLGEVRLPLRLIPDDHQHTFVYIR